MLETTDFPGVFVWQEQQARLWKSLTGTLALYASGTNFLNQRTEVEQTDIAKQCDTKKYIWLWNSFFHLHIQG